MKSTAVFMSFFRNYRSVTLIRTITTCSFLLLFAGCISGNPVEEYFEAHGYSYPSDVSGVSLFGIKYAGIERDELLEEGAREYIQDGIMFIKSHFHRKDFGVCTGDVSAIMVSDPVLYRDKSGDTGLMVKVTGYGSGEPGSGMKLQFEWIGKDKELWKAENFAYFNRRGLNQWMHGGWVY